MIHITKRNNATVYESWELGIAEDFFVRLYTTSGRSFPWRAEQSSPFGILIAEILLKQTHAEKVAMVWPTLIGQYSDADKLSKADPAELYDLIAVLGFGNQRVRALIEVASSITQSQEVPTQLDDLVKLPYVGIYTAHAVACFALGQPVPVVDLSIVRVISRLTGLKPPTDIRRAEAIWEVAWALLPKKNFKEHNYGLLDFGALICKSRKPLCNDCPIAANCAFVKPNIIKNGTLRMISHKRL